MTQLLYSGSMKLTTAPSQQTSREKSARWQALVAVGSPRCGWQTLMQRGMRDSQSATQPWGFLPGNDEKGRIHCRTHTELRRKKVQEIEADLREADSMVRLGHPHHAVPSTYSCTCLAQS